MKPTTKPMAVTQDVRARLLCSRCSMAHDGTVAVVKGDLMRAYNALRLAACYAGWTVTDGSDMLCPTCDGEEVKP